MEQEAGEETDDALDDDAKAHKQPGKAATVGAGRGDESQPARRGNLTEKEGRATGVGFVPHTLLMMSVYFPSPSCFSCLPQT